MKRREACEPQKTIFRTEKNETKTFKAEWKNWRKSEHISEEKILPKQEEFTKLKYPRKEKKKNNGSRVTVTQIQI